ncbi:MAG TPA: hypothetical protein VGZ47_01960, partial [Gemmataceae bacterium]|nr:hypothetical protein [Gemmataceae bacterium]
LLVASEKANSDLAAGSWVTLAGRSSETDYELWTNGKLIARGEVGEKLDTGPVMPVGVEVAGLAVADGKMRFELDHVAVWKTAPQRIEPKK